MGAAGTAVAVLLTAAIASMPSGPSVEAAGRYVVRSDTRVAPGLRLVRIVDRQGPNRITLLKLNLQSRLTLDVELATDRIPGHETTSSMATRNGAVAAINGDYTLLPTSPQSGRPVHTFAQNAALTASPLVYGRNFAMSSDESTVHIGHPRFGAWLTQPDSAETWTIDAWNKVPPAGGFSVYTMAGAFNHQPPRNACSARLFPSGPAAQNVERAAVEQTFTVAATQCAAERLNREGGTVISAPIGGEEGAKIAYGLTVGETVTLGWTTGWTGVEETIGGNPTLLESGRNTVGECPATSFFCARNPRTGIGVDAFGKVLMVTVDGRQEKSVGMTPDEFSELFRYLGATSALNLDGGGSTTMWVRGHIANRLSGTSERAVGSAILVVPQTFPQPAPTPIPSPTPTASATPAPNQLKTWSIEAGTSYSGADMPVGCAALEDPASTGGLLDFLADRGSLGTAFAGPVRRALAVYRGERTCAGSSERAALRR